MHFLHNPHRMHYHANRPASDLQFRHIRENLRMLNLTGPIGPESGNWHKPYHLYSRQSADYDSDDLTNVR